MRSWRSITASIGGIITEPFRKHVCREWPAAVFVPAIVMLMHHGFASLAVLDTRAFALIVNLAERFRLPDPRPSVPVQRAGAVIALIDTNTHEKRYLERSPLDRCRLLEDLGAVYAAKPHRVAIDLDLSPALLLEQPETAAGAAIRREHTCEDDLYALIKRMTRDEHIETVLMAPFETSPQRRVRLCEWQAQMRSAGVRFGRAELPVENGVVVNQYDEDDSFAAVAEHMDADRSFNCTTATERAREPAPEFARARSMINPLVYAAVYPVILNGDLSAPQSAQQSACAAGDWSDLKKPFAHRLACALQKLARSTEDQRRIVFFGAGYSADDTFITPIGELYGIEVQAGAYLSHIVRMRPANELVSFLVDVGMALVMGFVFACCWSRYFRHRLMTNLRASDRSTKYIVLAALAFVALVLVFCWASLFVMARFAIWLSPVPIAIGMLIDGFVSSSVQQAAHMLQARHRTFRDWRNPTVWLALRRGTWIAVVLFALALGWLDPN